MKTLYNIYEASILGDIETAINKDDITEMLWNGLCNGTRSEFNEMANWFANYMEENGKLDIADLGVYRKKIYARNKAKTFIRIMYNYNKSKILNIEVLTPNVKFYLSVNYPMAKHFNVNSYYSDEGNMCFNDSSYIYELPNEFKPFINKCIEWINKNAGTRKKFNLI